MTKAGIASYRRKLVGLRHRLSGISAIGEDSRSQSENKLHAVRRLRAAIALAVREPVALEGYVPSARLASLVAAGTAPLGAKTRQTGEYWAAIGELLDLLVAGGVGRPSHLRLVQRRALLRLCSERRHPLDRAGRWFDLRRAGDRKRHRVRGELR